MKASKPHEKGGKFCGDGFFLSRKEIGDLEKNKWRNGENFSYTKIDYFVSEENEKKMQGRKTYCLRRKGSTKRGQIFHQTEFLV